MRRKDCFQCKRNCRKLFSFGGKKGTKPSSVVVGRTPCQLQSGCVSCLPGAPRQGLGQRQVFLLSPGQAPCSLLPVGKAELMSVPSPFRPQHRMCDYPLHPKTHVVYRYCLLIKTVSLSVQCVFSCVTSSCEAGRTKAVIPIV